MDEFLRYLTLPYLWQGISFTAQLTALGFVGGLLLGGVLAAMQLTPFRVVRGIARAYVVIFRGTPLILQLVFVFTALPHAGISLPPILAGGVALALNEATFIAEIIRSAIRGVDPGQTAAGRSLGLAPTRVLRSVVWPQAVRSMVPALGNEAVATMKNSALASVIAVPELTLRTQQLASATFDYFSIYFATGVMYLLLTGVLTGVQLLLEDVLDLDRTHRRSLLGRMFGGRRGRKAAPTPIEPLSEQKARELQAEVADALTTETRPAGEVLVRLEGVEKSYGDTTVLRSVSLEVREGEVVALLGPSGSGKSTLLRAISALEPYDGGLIQIGDARIGFDAAGKRLGERALAAQRRTVGIGMVFQQFNLFAHLTARANIARPLQWVRGTSKTDSAERAEELLRRVGMLGRADDLPRRLSGGQQQRVGIARAIAMDPRVLLLDEPTSALDPELVIEVLAVIRGLAHHHGLTMIIATHQLGFAREVADRAVFMAGGVVVEEGPARTLLTAPREEATKRFVRTMTEAEV
ncbi:amino acid ABC transporter permease/ATP-binding protein [Microbacterium sp. CFBP 8794]|uniref:amino acid ABC transporter permease/ATP-binding protein n=1 Tax=Microbacterium sp. CFBP 8794 TaxID=2775269 RepID=UPI00177E02EA|nr:amino acid ABC transporter permease/ATP-binding protein [Microbacterium sp. CFBP 8794]MBD8479030.1 amino acid ABC transporter permease/ATP-binding protein [Microbacterium sp. CFBP 8794]